MFTQPKTICPGNWMKSTKFHSLQKNKIREEEGRSTNLFKKLTFKTTPSHTAVPPFKAKQKHKAEADQPLPSNKKQKANTKMKDKKHFIDHHLPPFSPSPSLAPTSTTDGPTVELPRRRRGRPPGSKNKLKPPSSSLSVSPYPSSSASPLPRNPLLFPFMRTLLLQIDPDNDVVDSVTRFCRNKSISLSLLSASGTLSHFTLRHPSSPPSTLTFRGRFDILSLSTTIVIKSNPGAFGVNNNSSAAPSSFYVPSGFAVTVSGPQGQVVGGAVGGPLIAAGPVFVVAASFDKPSYHRLPEIEGDEVEGEVVGSGGVGGGFGCHIGSEGSDVVWAPVATRPPY